MPFDSLCLRAVVDELQHYLVGGRIQRIIQPTASELVMEVYGHRRSCYLLISWDAAHARVHLVPCRPRSLPEPSPFCMALRKHIEGAVLVAAKQIGFDRVLELDIVRGETALTLVAEFMGRHSNVILRSSDAAIIAAAKVITKRQSRFRVVTPGASYVPPPPPRGHLDPFGSHQPELDVLAGTEQETLAGRLLETYLGMSPFLARLIAVRAASQGLARAWEAVFGAARRRQWSSVVARDGSGRILGAYPIGVAGLDGVSEESRESISVALTDASVAITDREAVARTRRELAQFVTEALEARTKQHQEVTSALAIADEAEELRRRADLLLAAAGNAQMTEGAVIVPDLYGDGAPVSVTLLPGLGVQESAEAYYARARKMARSRERLVARQQSLTDEIERLQAELRWLETEPEAGAIVERRRELAELGLIRDVGRSAAQPSLERRQLLKGIRVVDLEDGWEVWVGQNAEGNDRLLKLAAPDDLWFHVRAGTSAHVLVRTNGHPDRVPPRVIRLAAGLAARHSAAKHSAYVPVDYTLRKYVRRPRRAAPGRVFYRNETTVDVEPLQQGSDRVSD